MQNLFTSIFHKSHLLRILIPCLVMIFHSQMIVAQTCPPDNCPSNCTAGDVTGISYVLLGLDSIPLNASCTLGDPIVAVVYAIFETTATNRYDLVAFGNVESPAGTCISNFEVCLGDFENIQGSIQFPLDTVTIICGNDLQIVDSYFSWKVPDSDPDDCSLCSIQKSKCIRISAAIPIEPPLPIELLNFSVQKSSGSAIVKWVTLTELDNDHYELERSEDGKEFYTIGKVLGSGTSYNNIEYSFVDKSPLSGINYYRLKQVDYDGKYSYSRVRSLSFKDASQSQISVFPNPTNQELSLMTENKSGEVTVKILDVRGQVVTTQFYESGTWKQSMKIDISSLSEGMYLIDIIGGTQRETIRFVKGQ